MRCRWSSGLVQSLICGERLRASRRARLLRNICTHMKPETFRTLLAVAVLKDLHLGQMDVKSAYLHSEIEKEI